MTQYVFSPATTDQQVSWDDPSIWLGGVVPDGTDADAVLPPIANALADPYDYFVTINGSEAYAVRSLSLAYNDVVIDGSLAVSGSLSLGSEAEIDIAGGSLSFGALQNGGEDIQGNGTISSAGAIVNAGVILGGGLTLTAASLLNTGELFATEGGLTVDAPNTAGSVSSFAAGTLTGGTYAAGDGGTLSLDIGGVITVDDTMIYLDGPPADGPGTIESFDAESGTFVNLQDSLQTIGASGSLILLDSASYAAAGGLTVEGLLNIDGGTVSAAPLTITATGILSGIGNVAGTIVNDGVILATAVSQFYAAGFGSGPLVLESSVTGSGSFEIAPAIISDAHHDGFQDYTVSSGTLELGGATAENVTFDSGAGTLILDDPASFTGTITTAPTEAVNAGSSAFGLPSTAVDDTVILSGIAFSSVTGSAYSGTAAGGTFTVDEGSVSQTLFFAGDFTASSFILSAGTQPTSSSSPSLATSVVPLASAPSLGLAAEGGSAIASIQNSSTLSLTGTAAAGTTVNVFVDGTPEATAFPAASGGQTEGAYSATVSLTPGEHQIVAVATNNAGSVGSAPLPVFVLPDPTSGITTAAVSSAQIAALLDQGYSFQFASGTEAVQLTDGTLSVGPDTSQALLQRLYEGLLGRAGDTQGLEQFNAQLNQQGAAVVANGILNSAEFQQLHGPLASLDNTQFVTLLYQGFLGRAPDPGGLSNLVNALSNGLSRGAAASATAQSAEAKTNLAAGTGNVWVPDKNGVIVTELYAAGLNRVPDLAGLQSAEHALTAGTTPRQLANNIAASAEFIADHAGQDQAALVTSLYAAGLGRAPDPAGLTQDIHALQSGVSVGAVLLGIATSPEAGIHLIRLV